MPMQYPDMDETNAFLNCTELRQLDKYKPPRSPDFASTSRALGNALVGQTGQTPLSLLGLYARDPKKDQEEEREAADKWMAEIRAQPFSRWLEAQEPYREVMRFFANRRKARNCPAKLKLPYADIQILHAIAFGYVGYLFGKQGKPLRGTYSTASVKKAIAYVVKLLTLPDSGGLLDYNERQNLANLLTGLRLKTVNRTPKLDETLSGREFVHWTGMMFLSMFGETFSGAIAHAAIMVGYEPDKRTLDGQLKELRDAYKTPNLTADYGAEGLGTGSRGLR